MTTEADAPRNSSAISATAATLSGRAIPCLLSGCQNVRRVRTTTSGPGRRRTPRAQARGGSTAHRNAGARQDLVLLRGPPARAGPSYTLSRDADLRSSVELPPVYVKRGDLLDGGGHPVLLALAAVTRYRPGRDPVPNRDSAPARFLERDGTSSRTLGSSASRSTVSFLALVPHPCDERTRPSQERSVSLSASSRLPADRGRSGVPLLVLAGFAWGTGGLLGSLLGRETGLPPLAVAAYRLGLGGLCSSWPRSPASRSSGHGGRPSTAAVGFSARPSAVVPRCVGSGSWPYWPPPSRRATSRRSG